MNKSKDIKGKSFGYLKAIERVQDHISKSGQKKVRWLCECTLCGNKKEVNLQDLQRGLVISCGCYKTHKGKICRNKKICIVCKQEFDSPPSDKKVTCSTKCRKEYARLRSTGKTFSEERRKKITERSKDRDLSEMQSIAVEAAKNSPKSGRFITNINAKDWHLISPEGKHYYFHSLNFWLRENGRYFFGCEPDSREFNNVRSGLCNAKRATLGKESNGQTLCCTYKGWQVIPVLNETIIED